MTRPRQQQLRALVGARVSHVQGPQKVSHIAQQETGLKWVAEHGHTVVGTIHDLGVSASVNPFERPDLGPWLADDKSHEWDVLVFSKLDRLFRSTRDCVKFAEWADTHSKLLVFAEDGLTLNYRDRDQSSFEGMMTELFVYLGSFFAQLELNRFKTRALDGHRVLRQTTRWASGVPPLGFKVIDHPSGKGKGLATDTEGHSLLHQMAGKLLDGWSFVRIAAWLNDEGHLTNMDRARVAKGEAPKRRPWTVSTGVIDALTSPRTQGLKMHNGATVLDGDGEPIRLGPPTFDAAMWQQIQDAAALRQLNRRTPSETSNPMLGVGFCGCPGCEACAGASSRNGSSVCGASLAQQISRRKTKAGEVNVHRYYRCGRTPLNCNGVSIRADLLDELLEENFLAQWGDSPVTRRVFIPGEDRSHELDGVNESIARLRRESDAGLVVSEEDERVYLERMRSLIDRRTNLEATPVRAAGWVTEETGQTYREVWPDSDHRQLLIDAGIRFVLERGNPAPITHLYVPEDGVPIRMEART